MRNKIDLNQMACPDKYKDMGDFLQYFNGEKKAPCLTIFIGELEINPNLD
jgi:lariat debranching enzyme